MGLTLCYDVQSGGSCIMYMGAYSPVPTYVPSTYSHVCTSVKFCLLFNIQSNTICFCFCQLSVGT